MSEPGQRSLQSIRAEVDDYIRQFKTGYFLPLGQMARLMKEIGELACEVDHCYGEKQKKADEKPKTVSEELGDVFFISISMANSSEIDPTEAFKGNMAKFNKRSRYRFERKDRETHD